MSENNLKSAEYSRLAGRKAEKQPPFKDRVTAHWPSNSAPIMIGAKHRTEAADPARDGRRALLPATKRYRKEPWSGSK